MSRFDFSAVAPESVIKRGLRRLNPSRRSSQVVLWSAVAVAAVYTTGNPGQFTITTAADGGATSARFIQVQGAVENPSISAIQLHVNGAMQPVSVAGGQFSALVPLTRGENIIRASVAGSAANLVPGSNTIRVNAQIAPTDIWSALTWDGTADIDLHLVLPDGQDCYFRRPSVGGAILDFDNTVSDGPEHIVMEKATPGKYQVRVVYYAPNGAPRSVRWSVDLRLRDGRQQYNYSGVLDKVGEAQDVATFSFP